MFSKKRKLCCRFCFTDLWHEHTFIRCMAVTCVELSISICLQCFAAGTGDEVHKNSDPYQIQCNAIKVADHLWPAHEEILLLDTFMDTMSWEVVAIKLDRSPKECETYYFENFVINPKIKDLENVNKNAFRFKNFGDNFETKTRLIGDTSDIEGINILIISF